MASTILGRRDVAMVPWVSICATSIAIAVSTVLRGPAGSIDWTVLGIAIVGATFTAIMTSVQDLPVGLKYRESLWVYILGSGLLFINLAAFAYQYDGVSTPYFLATVPLAAYIGLVFPTSWRNAAFGCLLLGTLFLQLTVPGTSWFTFSIVEVLITAGGLVGILGSLAHAKAARIANEVSSFDGLTGMLNRRGFLEQLALHIERARPLGAEPISLLMIDLNGFKAVNDAQGHAAGDALLSWVGATIPGSLPPDAQLGRLGGDEFAVLLPAVTQADALAVARRVRAALGARIGASVGVASSPSTNIDPEAFLRVGDQALYVGKRNSLSGVHGLLAPLAPSLLASQPASRQWRPRRDRRGPLDYTALRNGARPEMPDAGIVYGWMFSRGLLIIAACGAVVVFGAIRVPGPELYDDALRLLGVPWVLWFVFLAWVAKGRDHLEGWRYPLVVYGSGFSLGTGVAMAMLAGGGVVAAISAALYLRVLFEAAIMPQRRAVIGLASMVACWALVAALSPPSTLWVAPFQLTLFASAFALGAIGHRAFDDITAQTRLLAQTDTLTNVRNRLGFEHTAAQALAAAKTAHAPLCVLALDLDGFKQVNDTRGHAAGDELLRNVAGVLSTTFPDAQTIGRLGGDEFAVVLPVSTFTNGDEDATRLTAALLPIVGASVGHAVFPGDGDDLETLLGAADERSYEVKRLKPQRDQRATAA